MTEFHKRFNVPQLPSNMMDILTERGARDDTNNVAHMDLVSEDTKTYFDGLLGFLSDYGTMAEKERYMHYWKFVNEEYPVVPRR